ncbi:TBC1 domain family member 2A [Chelonia mydas]|uniref:TBC1 domain family member 2A n=1 Tax=Chelonia mydas TaxID=8469 RepID=M7CA81_CHEMY|nr:TBC1 domain family member 2A [Chelonia mydas]
MERRPESGECLLAGIPGKPLESNSDDDNGNAGSAKERAVSSPHRDLGNAQLNPSREEPRKKLCGYLNKLGVKGPIKAWKSRWFFYDENKCHLLYCRTAQDVNPLGSIDLSSASFDCQVEADEGVFEIRTPSKVFILKAVSRQAMMYWLQQLQMKRWAFCNTLTGLPVDSITVAALPANDSLLNEIIHTEGEGFFPPVKTPTDVVGLKAASLPAPQLPAALQNISLKHPWTEIQNTIYNICGSRQLPGNGRSISGVEGFPEHPGTLAAEQEVEGEAECPVREKAREDTQAGPRSHWPRKGKWLNSGFPAFAEGLARERSSPDKVAVLQQQVLALTEEIKSQKELVTLLHKALEAAQQEKRASSRYLAAAEDKDRLELVRHKVRQIVELSNRVEALETDKKELEQSLALRDNRVEELQKHVQLLMEKNYAKQQVILKLTEQVVLDLSEPAQEADAVAADTLHKQQEEIEHLKDDLDAYRTQNQFLNSEIHQVTKLWRSVAEKEKVLLMKCARLQARSCQVESKYLMLLRRLQEASPGLASSDAELVKSLIQEALQWDAKEEAAEALQLNPVREYDDYGFMTIPKYEVEDWKLLAKIQALEIKSNNLLSHMVVEKPLRERWAGMAELSPSAELKGLIRCGVPMEHRQRVWKWIVSQHLSHHHPANHYESLLQQGKRTEHPAFRQIELDLPRTLTNNRHFTSPTSQLVPKLRRVLLAFSWQNPAIGYCQGLNRLAAIALLVLEEEESAFWCLVHIVENLMPADYYSDTLIASQVDQRVFKDFLSEKLPRLTAHFEQHRIDVSLITFNWFLVAFVDSLVSDILFRVWDAFLYEGTKVIFRYALAIFKYNEEEILRIHDSLEVYQYLRFFTHMIGDGRKLMSIAFSDMNPFPMKVLRNRRATHRAELEAELSELERIKAQYVKEQAEQVTWHLDGAVSEEEEEM